MISMKNFYILLVVLLLSACSESQKPEAVTIIKGSIQNVQDSELTLSGHDYREKIQIKEDGTFLDTIDIASGYYTMYLGNNRATVYLSSGTSLEVNANTTNFDSTLSYVGIGAPVNDYLNAKSKIKTKVLGPTKELYALEEAEFLDKITTSKSELLSTLNNAQLDPSFTEIESKDVNYDYLANIQKFQDYHRYYADDEEFIVSEGFMAEVDKLQLDNEENFVKYPAFRSLVNGYYSEYTYGDKLKEGLIKLESLKSQSIKNNLVKSFAYNISPGNEMNDTLYSLLFKQSDDLKFRDKLTEKFEKINKLNKGMASPTFDNYENHAGGKTSLKDLQGKYTYIDVWATWCGPCKAEIPYLKEVEGKYHDKNIQFVSISIDKAKDHDKWDKMIQEKSLGGIQLFADNDWKSQFVTDYAIDGIPRFILIDPAGKIVSGDAPRPSDEALIDLFNELRI